MKTGGGLARIIRTLRHRNYGLYAAGNLVSLIGLWTQRVGVGWLAWDLTGSGLWLGLTALADLFPAALVGPVAGAFADRLDRLRIMRVTQSIQMVQAFALCALTATGHITPAVLVALVLAGGVVDGFNQPARLATVPSLVPRADLPSAVAINAVVFNTARFIGPAAAGALILTGGVAFAFAVNALSYLAFLAALSRIRLDPATAQAGGGTRRGLGADIAAGVRYVAAHRGIGPLLGMSLALSLGARPFVELFPRFADRVLGGGPETLAALGSAVGAGAVAGGLWLAQRGDATSLARVVVRSAGLAATAVLCFALAPGKASAVALAALAGVLIAVTGISVQTLIQSAVDPAMRARVMSLYGVVFRAGPAAGALAIGIASDVVGLRLPLAAGAIGAACVWVFVWRHRAGMEAALEATSP